jgi:iron(II)-dependent oxidoreductase
MSGNVSEWVADWYDKEFYKKPEALFKNPENREKGSGLRVMRGGAWFANAAFLRVTNRAGSGPADRNVLVGFRCVAPLPQ